MNLISDEYDLINGLRGTTLIERQYYLLHYYLECAYSLPYRIVNEDFSTHTLRSVIERLEKGKSECRFETDRSFFEKAIQCCQERLGEMEKPAPIYVPAQRASEIRAKPRWWIGISVLLLGPIFCILVGFTHCVYSIAAQVPGDPVAGSVIYTIFGIIGTVGLGLCIMIKEWLKR